MSARAPRPPAQRAYKVFFSFLAERQVLVVCTQGVLATSVWPEISRMATEEGAKHGCRRYLFDQRAARFRFRFADLWALPRNMGAFKLPDGARIALLLPSPAVREKDFIEAFNRNRGFDLKVFGDEDAALAWLSEPVPSRNPLQFP